MSNPKHTSNLKQKHDLIAAVRAKSSLHNPQNAYLRSKHRVWSQVAIQCGIDRDGTAKVMWKNICDEYVSYLENPDKNKNRELTSLFKRLKFMDKYLKIHPTHLVKTYVSDCNENSEIVNNQSITGAIENFVPVLINEAATNGEFTTIQFWSDSKDKEEDNQTEVDTKNEIINESNNDDCLEVCSDSESEINENVVLPDGTSNSNNCNNDNSLKMFFDAMFATTSQLPPTFQRMIKRKIFAAVLEAEEDADSKN